MATANTVIIPAVYSGVVQEKIKGIVKISQLADELGFLEGNAGDTVTFPVFKSISDAVLMAKGDAITPEMLNQDSTSKKISQYGKAVRVLDIDSLTALGNFVDNASKQQATTFARALDLELVKDIDATCLLKSATAQAKSLTEDDLINGFQMFGDDQNNEDMAGIVVNSLLAPSFYKMDGFVKADITYSVVGNGAIWNGCIGYYRGTIPVILSDVGTFDTVKSEVKSYIIKKNSLAIMPKRNVNIELEREAKLKATDVVGDYIFATGLIDRTGCVILRKSIV